MARFDKFTLKSQEAVQAAQDLAGKLRHQQIESEHLMLALIDQPEGVVVPILKKLGADPGRIKVVKVNSDENPALSHQFGIQGIPTIILFRDGKEIDRLVGAASRESIIQFLRL